MLVLGRVGGKTSGRPDLDSTRASQTSQTRPVLSRHRRVRLMSWVRAGVQGRSATCHPTHNLRHLFATSVAWCPGAICIAGPWWCVVPVVVCGACGACCVARCVALLRFLRAHLVLCLWPVMFADNWLLHLHYPSCIARKSNVGVVLC